MTNSESTTTINAKQLAIFNYKDSVVRNRVLENGEIWWVAKGLQ